MFFISSLPGRRALSPPPASRAGGRSSCRAPRPVPVPRALVPPRELARSYTATFTGPALEEHAAFALRPARRGGKRRAVISIRARSMGARSPAHHFDVHALEPDSVERLVCLLEACAEASDRRRGSRIDRKLDRDLVRLTEVAHVRAVGEAHLRGSDARFDQRLTALAPPFRPRALSRGSNRACRAGPAPPEPDRAGQA